MPAWMSVIVPIRVTTRASSTTVRYAGFSRTRSSRSGTSSSRAVASRITPSRCTVPAAVDVPPRQHERELRDQLLGRLWPQSVAGRSARSTDCRESSPPAAAAHHSTSRLSQVTTSFSVSTLVSPAFRRADLQALRPGVGQLVALDRRALVVVDDDRAALADVGHLAELRRP